MLMLNEMIEIGTFRLVVSRSVSVRASVTHTARKLGTRKRRTHWEVLAVRCGCEEGLELYALDWKGIFGALFCGSY